MRRLLFILLITAVFALTGCIEEENEYFVNPDGSGKVIHEVFTAQGGNFDLSGYDEKDPQQQLKKLAQDTLQNSEGIDTWSDVSIDITDEGKLHFKGTAYFKDISKVSFNTGNMSNDSGLSINMDKKGLLVLKMGQEVEGETDETKDYTDQEIAEEIRTKRLEYNQSKVLMASVLKDMKNTTIVHYNGRLKKSVNFKKGNNTVTLIIDGKKQLEYIDHIMSDDKKMEQLIRSGKSLEDSDMEGYFEFIGGEPELPYAEILLSSDMIDYAKDAVGAKAKYDDMIKSLKLTTAAKVNIKTAEYKPGMEVQDLRVGGVRIVYFENKDVSYRPFYQSKSFGMSLIGRMPVEGLELAESQLTKALTVKGEDLMPKSSFNRDLSSPEILKDGISVKFEIKMELPEKDFSGFSELAGEFKCFKAKGEKKIDLGLMEIKKGSGNKEEGITINKAGKSDWGDDYEISLKMNILKYTLKDIQLFRADGSRVKTSVSGGMSMSGYWLERSIRTEEKLPEKGRIVIVLNDNLEEYTIPFSLKNVSLLGKPLGD